MKKFTFYHDGTPNHWHFDVRKCLNRQLPQHWIGRNATDDLFILSYAATKQRICDTLQLELIVKLQNAFAKKWHIVTK